jgi:hypothetical protein
MCGGKVLCSALCSWGELESLTGRAIVSNDRARQVHTHCSGLPGRSMLVAACGCRCMLVAAGGLGIG